MYLNQSLLIPAILACLSGICPAEATTYTVKAAGGGDYTTIQACANAVVAGDTCTIFAGTYAEYVKVPTSGSAGNPITFSVNPGDAVSLLGFTITSHDYITIGGGSLASGFEITDPALSVSRPYCISLTTTNHISILYNNIHECGTGSAVRSSFSSLSNYTIVRGNIVAWPNAHPAPPCTTSCGDGASGINLRGAYNLIEYNDISHVTDFLDIVGSFPVVRGNMLHSVRLADFPSTTNQMHVDGFQSNCSVGNPLVHALIESNTVKDSTTPNSHAWLLHDEAACGSHGVIVRYNTIINIGSGYLYDDAGGLSEVKDYNNSLSYIQQNRYQGGFAAFINGAVNGSLINDLFYNATPNNSNWYTTDGSTVATFVAKHNLGYISSCDTGCLYPPPFGTDIGNIFNQDPLLEAPSSDLHLRIGSPGRGAGTYLTTVAGSDAGSGITLVVNDVGFFQDGSGIVDADWIRVGPTNTGHIASIDYSTNTMTLVSGISRSTGDPVYLYRDSSRRVVLLGSTPDIGAYQYGSSRPEPPTELKTVTR